MRNPFKELKTPRLENPKGEEVSGTFFCQERGCYQVTKTARYLEEVQILTWKCNNEHTNKIEGFKIG
jgi:hypothetical protein